MILFIHILLFGVAYVCLREAKWDRRTPSHYANMLSCQASIFTTMSPDVISTREFFLNIENLKLELSQYHADILSCQAYNILTAMSSRYFLSEILNYSMSSWFPILCQYALMLGIFLWHICTYEKVSNVPESRVWFASKNLKLRRMH